MTTDHPFQLNGRYRTRGGDYTVIAIDGDTMTARFDDGREQRLNVATQERIWRNILDDELAAAGRSDFSKRDFDPDQQLVTWPVRLLVEDVLRAAFAPPYPPDIIDQVCLAIEDTPTGCSATAPSRPSWAIRSMRPSGRSTTPSVGGRKTWPGW